MTWMYSISDFLLSQWLWSITWGVYHLPLCCIFMALLFKWVTRMSLIPALCLSFLTNIVVFGFYTLIVVGIIFLAIDHQNQPEQLAALSHKGLAYVSLYLGLIYAVLSSIFFALLNMRYRLNMRSAIIISIMSNVLASWIVYLLVPLY